jgi:hypothetical protein
MNKKANWVFLAGMWIGVLFILVTFSWMWEEEVKEDLKDKYNCDKIIEKSCGFLCSEKYCQNKTGLYQIVGLGEDTILIEVGK